ncbi:MAG: chemotaxis protein CheB [Verrucomicrobiota bacterium]
MKRPGNVQLTPSRSRQSRRKPECPLVALGGSAGSVDALIEFFALMPEDCGMAFVVVVHLPSNQESLLPTLLQRRCLLPVIPAEHDLAIRANRVFVIPAGRVLSRFRNRLKSAPAVPSGGKLQVIDVLFRSIADESHGAIAGIVLSGADADGAAGLRHIRQSGGLTLVQDPGEARYETMPRAAVATGCVDATLRVSEMPARLFAHFGIAAAVRPAPMPSAAPFPLAEPMPRPETAQVSEVILCLRQRTGRDFSGYRQSVFLRHIRRRMILTGRGAPESYLNHLRMDAAEPEALIRELLVSVTGFFRDPEAFGALARHLPQLFQGKTNEDIVRVWVPACATGEEAYSVAMLLLEHAESLSEPPGIQVFGGDLDAAAIAKARAGLYPVGTAAAVGPERLLRFFEKQPGGYRVRRELRQVVLFAVHDLGNDCPFARIDLVTCRNLLIYLNPAGQRRMLDVFDFALGANGLLFLGAAEGVITSRDKFQPLDLQYRIYQRRRLRGGSGPPRPAETGSVVTARALGRQALRDALRNDPSSPKKDNRSWPELQGELNRLLARLAEDRLPLEAHPGPPHSPKQALQEITQQLQAAMEELEVNRQELRSMNAELAAVNSELHAKLSELGRANNDLSNLMNATAIPTVFLDRGLRIMRYTPTATGLFSLIPGDLGRPLADLSSQLVYPGLFDDVQCVLSTGESLEQEVRDGAERRFLARILPYRTPEQGISGVVITFVDITARARIERSLLESRTWLAAQKEAFEAAVKGAPLPVSLGLLVRSAATQAGTGVRCAFYIVDSDRRELRYVVGMPDAYAECVDGFEIGPDSLPVVCRLHGSADHHARPDCASSLEAMAVAGGAIWLPRMLVLPNRDGVGQGGGDIRDVFSVATGGFTRRLRGSNGADSGRRDHYFANGAGGRTGPR